MTIFVCTAVAGTARPRLPIPTQLLTPDSIAMAQENKEWICSVCGYRHIGPEPPKECPVCHVSREYFDEAGTDPESEVL